MIPIIVAWFLLLSAAPLSARPPHPQQTPIVIDISNCSPDGTGNVYVVPNVPFSCTLRATGGTPPYSWSITNGTLPSSFTLDPVTGVLSGTLFLPEAPANFGATPVKKRKKRPDRMLLVKLQ